MPLLKWLWNYQESLVFILINVKRALLWYHTLYRLPGEISPVNISDCLTFSVHISDFFILVRWIILFFYLSGRFADIHRATDTEFDINIQSLLSIAAYEFQQATSIGLQTFKPLNKKRNKEVSCIWKPLWSFIDHCKHTQITKDNNNVGKQFCCFIINYSCFYRIFVFIVDALWRVLICA